MQFWNLKTQPTQPIDGMALLPVIDAIGAQPVDSISNAILKSVQSQIRVTHCSIFLYRGAASLELVSGADRLSRCVATENARPYISGRIFQLDSNQGILNDKTAALPGTMLLHHHTIADLRDSSHKELYFNADLLERVSVMHCLPDLSWLAINLYRQRCDGGIDGAELQRTGEIGVPIAHCVARHLSLTSQLKRPEPRTDFSAESLLETIEREYPELPRREREVMCGLLRGQTADGIACHLGVGAATVVTYKQRLFRRLGINTRGQLFALFSKYA
jgi:DNA-binding CsgD family transcriptional regulator